MRNLKRYIGILAALVLAASYILPTYADIAKSDESDKTVTTADMTAESIVIRTVADLENLANECRLDSWSKDKVIRLDADISVKGSSFDGIPIFAGCFDGQGHTISDIKFDSSEVNAGFFGFISESATVKNLILRGKYTPDGVISALGAVTSVNKGIIKNCAVDVTIDNATISRDLTAAQYTGGIAGINEESGSIINCSVFGKVSGLKYTGGITGQNKGSIVGCNNDAEVNTDVKDKKIKLREIKERDGLKKLVSANKVYASENTGGIAGTNDGYIIDCNNTGSVGTKDNGYNVGGIAGRSNGYISGCNNMGRVRGSNNIGGVAGQLEPCISISYGKDILEKPREDIDEVFGIVDKTIGDINTDINGVSNEISNALDTMKNTLDLARSVENRLVTYSNEVIATLNTIPDGINQLMDSVHSVTEGIEEMSRDAQSAMTSIGYGVKGISRISDTADNTITEVKEKISPTEYTVSIEGKIYWDAEALTDAVPPSFVYLYVMDEDGNIAKEARALKNPVSPYEWNYHIDALPQYGPDGKEKEYHVVESIREVLEQPSLTLTVTSSFLPTYEGNDIHNIYVSDLIFSSDRDDCSGSILWDDNPGTSRPAAYVYSILEYEYDGKEYEAIYNSKKVSGSTGDIEWVFGIENIPESIDVVIPGYADMGTTISFAPDLRQLLISPYIIRKYDPTHFLNEYISQESGRSVIGIIIDGVHETSDDVEAVVGDFQSATTYMSAMMADLNRAMNDVNNIGMPHIDSIPPIPEDIKNDLEKITDSLGDILGAVDKINKQLNNTQHSLTSNAKSLNSQFNTIADSIFDVAYGLNTVFDNLIVNASDALTDQEGVEVGEDFNQFGAIYNCGNTGDVSGNSNIGGIAGTMTLSRIPVLYQTQKPEKSLSLPSFRYKATINGCNSEANVVGEKDYVGLICGSSNLGSIRNCAAKGNARSRNGMDVGGIAGYAHGLVSDCSSRCYLEGKAMVGGIIGEGSKAEMLLPQSEVNDCLAVVEIGKRSNYNGSIAGEYIGSFKNNKYFSKTNNGINSFNIEGEFEPVSEKELKQLDGYAAFIKAGIPDDGLKQKEAPDIAERSVFTKVLIYVGVGFGAILLAALILMLITKIKRRNIGE